MNRVLDSLSGTIQLMTLLPVRLFLVLALCFAPIITTGCKTATTVQHPGSINAADSQIYDILVSVRAALVTASTNFGSNPKAVPILNDLRKAFDTADAAYQAYHTAGVANATVEASLNSQLAGLQTQLAALPKAVQ